MAQDHEYVCSGCGAATRRSMLTVKKVMFTTMGEGARTTRARVKAWLCVDCVKKDEDWNLPAYRQPSERVKAPVIEPVSDEDAARQRIRESMTPSVTSYEPSVVSND